MMNNKHSLELQYALKNKAIDYGWDETMILIIDTDLGVTGSGKVKREGFQNMLIRVTSGEVGIVFAYDVTRLSRNCADWYGLLDICGYKGSLIADSDGVYNPMDINDRLLLGLKGQLAEFELRTIRSRMNDGLMNKIKKGLFYPIAPAGFIKSPLGKLEIDPNQDVQKNIELVFTVFRKYKTVSKVLTYFRENKLDLVRNTSNYGIVWKEATSSSLLRIMKNPAYAGIYAYGRTKAHKDLSVPCGERRSKISIENCKVYLEDNHQGYISKDEYYKNQEQIKQNYAEYINRQSNGVPRAGNSLLHGLLYCGKCGHKMYVVYKKKNFYYSCNSERRSKRKIVCEVVTAPDIDNAVTDAFIEAMNPVNIDAYNAAIQSRNESYDQTKDLLKKRIERREYEARVREKQYSSVDPENRLVASSLERNWEIALQEVDAARQALKDHSAIYEHDLPISQSLKELFSEVGKNIGAIWHDGSILPIQHKKGLLRTLIEKINISRKVHELCLIRIVWKSGLVSEIQQPIKINKLENLSTHENFMITFKTLYDEGYTDKGIAEKMTKLGFRGAASFVVTEVMVKGLRRKLKMYNDSRGKEKKKLIKDEYLTVADIMKITGKGRSWVHYHIYVGNISGVKSSQKHNIYLFPNNEEFVRTVKNLGRLNNNEKVGQK